MELAELRKHWNKFGETDPFWAILSLPGKRYGKWDPEEFFRNGEDQISGLMEDIAARGLRLKPGRALDFGCGVGRLTQALCHHFDVVCGVDISAAMIENARRYNRHGERCRYFLNERGDLSLFDDDSVAFIFSIIVLQHMRPEYMRNYLKEFLRVLEPGGLAVFQIPSGPAPREEQPVVGPEVGQIASPLPDSAFRARITLLDLPSRMEAGARVEVRVRVKNLSEYTWSARGQPDGRFWIKLGNHWLDQDRNLVICDDARSCLPVDMGPGAEADFPLIVTAPSVPGRYYLEADMVQEWVSWFKDKGSTPALAAVEVVEDKDADHFVPQIEMYSIPREEVVDFVERHGGRILDVQRVNEGGPILDFNYYMTK